MCRHIAYIGPPVTLGEVLLAPEHALVHQSYRPRHQRHGRINADGFGVGWYAPDHREEPARYRTVKPMWTDRTFASIAGVISTSALLGAVRNASVGFPIEETGCAPFTRGKWLFSLNGVVHAFRDGIGSELRAELPSTLLDTLEGVVDTEVVFLMAISRIATGVDPAEALEDVIRTVFERTTGRLNLLLTDGSRIVATAAGDSLFVRTTGESVVVASEPYDDDEVWQPVLDGHLVDATVGAFEIRAMAGVPPS